MRPTARLLMDPPRDAATNMATDSALFQSAPSSPFPATLRVYGWKPRAVSIGRRQKSEDLNLRYCMDNGIDVVKRPGGGAAVYHDREITYAFVCRTDLLTPPTSGEWRKVFTRLLEKLGLAADDANVCRGGSAKDASCFSCAGEDEPTVNGKKFVGNSRRKSKTAYMQHGSILLESQPDFLRRAVRNPGTDNSVGLLDLAPALRPEKVSEEFISAVSEILNLNFQPTAMKGEGRPSTS
ncbi:MAG: hypothetical protein HY280_07940 [Nitrospinae bacterium]|nr:hypothetical protein [Nitrospinota bacterium]